MSRYDKGFWPTLLCTISLILLAFGMISAAFATNLYENKPVTRICHFTWNFSWYFVVLSTMIFLLVCVHYLFKIFRKVKKSSSANNKGKGRNEIVYFTNSEDIYVLTYIGIIFAVFIFMIVVAISNPDIIHMGKFPLILASIPFACFIFFLAIMYMRIAQSEMTDAVVSTEYF
jgi:hypothetical protein